ncbi:MAG: hypothetical protein A2X80_00720 [Geobacteraceae bacterium GWB2_52_12]|nr:MAG: hypothetical protein A2X80_00720 [Geobacteraceae bacterium GWB2_52_12]
MKCPKCGYNSFEYYDSCKKCFNDLTSFKQTHSIAPIVLPQEAKEKLSAEFRSSENPSEVKIAAPDKHDDIFSFDLPEESKQSAVKVSDDPFGFDETSTHVDKSNTRKSEDNIFADLLESTSQTDESPFASEGAAVPKPASPSSSGELDLDSFSWDEPAAPTAAPGSTVTADDFDSLFGDTKKQS